MSGKFPLDETLCPRVEKQVFVSGMYQMNITIITSRWDITFEGVGWEHLSTSKAYCNLGSGRRIGLVLPPDDRSKISGLLQLCGAINYGQSERTIRGFSWVEVPMVIFVQHAPRLPPDNRPGPTLSGVPWGLRRAGVCITAFFNHLSRPLSLSTQMAQRLTASRMVRPGLLPLRAGPSINCQPSQRVELNYIKRKRKDDTHKLSRKARPLA